MAYCVIFYPICLISSHHQISEEGSTVSCIVERTRGALDSVYVNYTVTQLDSPARTPSILDFAKPIGSIFFFPGQRSEVT